MFIGVYSLPIFYIEHESLRALQILIKNVGLRVIIASISEAFLRRAAISVVHSIRVYRHTVGDLNLLW